MEGTTPAVAYTRRVGNAANSKVVFDASGVFSHLSRYERVAYCRLSPRDERKQRPNALPPRIKARTAAAKNETFLHCRTSHDIFAAAKEIINAERRSIG